METTVHFSNIGPEIAKRLSAATEEIVVAVTLFTDPEWFDILCQQAGRGVQVRLAVPNHPDNIGRGRLNFQRLHDIGGEVFLLPVDGVDAPAIDHNFCIIDRAIVITGSHDWTKHAQGSNDGIVIIIANGFDDDGISESDGATGIAADYLDAFDDLLEDHGLGPRPVDAAEARRRLEVIRHLLALEDWDSLATQIDKLRPARRELGLDSLFTALQDPADGAAAAWINDYLNSDTELSTVRRQQTVFLHLAVRALDLQISALLDEKAEIERQLHAFSVRTHYSLGDLTSRYLELQAEKLRRQAAVDPSLQGEAERAQTEYQEYCDADACARTTPLPAQLDAEGQAELKRLYRLTSQRCHPDKVHHDDQERATQFFMELQTAYRNNDLVALRAIHARVRDGHLFVHQGVVLTDVDALRHAILVLRHDLDQHMAEIQELRSTDSYRTMKDLTDWDAYFDEQVLFLGDAVLRLEDELLEMEQQAADTDGQAEVERARFKAFLHEHPNILLQGLSAHVPLGFDLLRRFPKHWDWAALSRSQAISWTPALIARFSERWDWLALSRNPTLPWSQALIERFADSWHWDALSANPALPWSLDLLERFRDRWHATAANHLLPIWDRLHGGDLLELMERASIHSAEQEDPFRVPLNDDGDSNEIPLSRRPQRPTHAPHDFDNDIPF